MGNHHQLRLPVLHEGSDSADPYSKDRWPLSGAIPLASSFCLSLRQQFCCCFSCCLWPALVNKLKKLSRCLMVQGRGWTG